MITIRQSAGKKNLSSLVARGEEQGIRPVAKKLRLSAKWAKNTIPCGEECPPVAGMEREEGAFTRGAVPGACYPVLPLIFLWSSAVPVPGCPELQLVLGK